MQLTRRNFVTAGAGLVGAALLNPLAMCSRPRLVLDQDFIDRHKRTIEEKILAAMEKVFLQQGEIFNESYRPGAKFNEKVVSFYDYLATGISVVARHAARGESRALTMMEIIQRNIRYYQEHIFGTNVGGILGDREWSIPLRRLLLHIALAYKEMEPKLTEEEKQWYAQMIDQQVQLAIEHNRHFYPGELKLKRTSTNNHTAIFMQGIYYCGKVFNRPDWVELTEEFAQRMFNCIHPDGYFEENTNDAAEGGPSMIYTRLSVGCLYDVLDGKNKAQEIFVRAGNFYRSFVNHDYQMISIADERTNCHLSKGLDYGLALHSLTPKGRYYIVDNLDHVDYEKVSIEYMAVLYHELSLMRTGNCEIPENRLEGNSRITLPLGVVRRNGFTGGLSALLALNRIIRAGSDYALDQQNMVYLSHQEAGLILIGYKSKRNPLFSTFRIGDDAYTVKTGDLEMGDGWAEATLYYETFIGRIRWEIGKTARLILSSDSDQVIASTLTVTDEKFLKTDSPYQMTDLDGFSPYTENNKADKISAAVFEWKKQLVVEFIV